MNTLSSVRIYSNEYEGEDEVFHNAAKQLKLAGNVSSGKCLPEVFHERCFDVHGIGDLVVGNHQGEVPDEALHQSVAALNDVLVNGGLIVTFAKVT